ncbi:5-(carboxyamino)imidazole ribonucleotide mutase [Periweissella ghanensis]|uniref:N5-carboxyaminoimidazole ribonucleotide mutase n=1 Tax=Periweissella ghanensis TaxID=467997 RepID=A0ABM8ZCA8_9LACO|nr:5-(carboxyamino)imidazole ribonucleotide mutase [Periweissella ghanensis]CAH0418920.1 N5-carboxyaminoimidazole ribonucleotide mutase [Periweissella ghanensis]
MKVAVIMGSVSDWPTMKLSTEVLTELGVEFTKHVISAHRMPTELQTFGLSARDNGYHVIIAGAGGAAHLPGMLAANTTLPVIGVPVQSKALSGLDSLLSIVQMPAGIPVATVAIGSAGAKNAALLAAQIGATTDEQLAGRLATFRQRQTTSAIESEALLDD